MVLEANAEEIQIIIQLNEEEKGRSEFVLLDERHACLLVERPDGSSLMVFHHDGDRDAVLV